MENRINLNISEKEYKLIKGALQTARSIFLALPMKTKEVKDKIIEITNFLEKLN